MAGETLSNAAAIFNAALKRQQVLPMMYDRVNRSLDFLRPAGLMAPTIDVYGQGLDAPLILRGPRTAVGMRAERDPMPTTRLPNFQKAQFFTKRNIFYFDVTEEQMGAFASSEGSWERIQAIYVFEGAQEIADRLQTYAFLDGTSRLARMTVVAGGATSTLTVVAAGGVPNAPDAADENGAFYIKPGDYLAAVATGATPVFGTGTFEVASVNRDVTPNTITVTGNVTTGAVPWVAGNFLVYAQVLNNTLLAASVGANTDCGAGTQSGMKAPEGLYRWFSDVNNYDFNTTFGNTGPGGIQTADNWAGFVINDSAAPAPFDVAKFHRLYLTMVKRFGHAPTLAVTSLGVGISISEALFTADKRYNDTTKASKLGIDFGSIKIDEVDFIFSRSCPPQTMFVYAKRDDVLAPNQQGPPHWAGMDGNVLHLISNLGTVYEGILIFPWNLFSRGRTGGAIWRGIKEIAKVSDISI